MPRVPEEHRDRVRREVASQLVVKSAEVLRLAHVLDDLEEPGLALDAREICDRLNRLAKGAKGD